MNATTENTARATAVTLPIRSPRTLEELLDREEALATQGIERGVALLASDARDALNLPLHWRRNPFKTSAIVGAVGLLLFGYAKRPRRMKRGRSPSGLAFLARTFLSTSVTGAIASRIGRSLGWSNE